MSEPANKNSGFVYFFNFYFISKLRNKILITCCNSGWEVSDVLWCAVRQAGTTMCMITNAVKLAGSSGVSKYPSERCWGQNKITANCNCKTVSLVIVLYFSTSFRFQGVNSTCPGYLLKKCGDSCQRAEWLVFCQKDLCLPPGLTLCPSCLCRTNYLEELNYSNKSAPHRDWNLFEVGLFVTHCIW